MNYALFCWRKVSELTHVQAMRLVGIMTLWALSTCGVALAAPIIWSGNGHAYDFIRADGIQWSAAKDQARRLSFRGAAGHLATITSQSENDFVADLIAAAKSQLNLSNFIEAWIGAEQRDANAAADASWSWITGEPWQFTNWDSDEPNDSGGHPLGFREEYLGMWGPDGSGPLGQWNDQGGVRDPHVGGNIQGFVVEYAIPEPSAFVLASLGLVAFVRRRSCEKVSRECAKSPRETLRRVSMISKKTATLIAAAIVVSTAVRTAWSQPVPFDGNYYEFVQASVNWTDARNAAAARSYGGVFGHLATVTTQAENDFLFGLRPAPTQTFQGAWIGVQVTAGAQTWAVGPEVGTALLYKNWGGSEPNNGGFGYVHIGSAGFAGIAPGRWADARNGIISSGDPVIGYFVEYEAVPEPATFALAAPALIAISRRRSRIPRRRIIVTYGVQRKTRGVQWLRRREFMRA